MRSRHALTMTLVLSASFALVEGCSAGDEATIGDSTQADAGAPSGDDDGDGVVIVGEGGSAVANPDGSPLGDDTPEGDSGPGLGDASSSTDASTVDDGGGFDSGSISDSGSIPDSGVDSGSIVDAGPDAAVVYPDLYDANTIPKFELVLDAEAIAVLSNTATDDASKKAYAHATFKYGAETVLDVGVRRKGSSTFRSYPGKMSLKVKFNKFVKGQRFNGLTDLTLNNMVSDSTFLAERLSYYAFRQAGVPAPKANTAELYINGSNWGIYANVETPDGDFLRRTMGDDGKTLYEANFGSTWLPGTDGAFEIDVGDTTDDLKLLFTAVQGAKSATLLADVSTRLNTDLFLKASAMEALTSQIDGYAYGKYGSHNYYLAGSQGAVFTLIPWSLDLTLSDNNGIVNSSTPGAVDPAQPALQTLLKKCSLSTSCWATYKTTMADMITLYKALDLVNLAKAWHAQINTLALADPKKEASAGAYNGETAKLYTWLANQPTRVKGQLALP